MAEETSSNKLSPGLWPALTYRYIEHYFWEPQHFGRPPKNAADIPNSPETKPFQEFKRRLKSQEVPLNYLLNVFLRLCSQSAKQTIFAVMGSASNSDAFVHLDLCFPEDKLFVQPDVVLESPQTRICIEVKVGAKTDLEQVQKYCFLHAHLNSLASPKRPFLMYLLQNDFASHWRPTSEKNGFMSGSTNQCLKQMLLEKPLEAKLDRHKSIMKYQRAYQDVVDQIELITATWQQFGDAVNTLMNLKMQDGGEAAEMFGTLAGDFLLELQERSLWKPGTDMFVSNNSRR